MQQRERAAPKNVPQRSPSHRRLIPRITPINSSQRMSYDVIPDRVPECLPNLASRSKMNAAEHASVYNFVKCRAEAAEATSLSGQRVVRYCDWSIIAKVVRKHSGSSTARARVG